MKKDNKKIKSEKFLYNYFLYRFDKIINASS